MDSDGPLPVVSQPPYLWNDNPISTTSLSNSNCGLELDSEALATCCRCVLAKESRAMPLRSQGGAGVADGSSALLCHRC